MYIKESEFHRLGFDQMEELRPEVWSQLDNSRKVAVLQDCVNRICAFERRPRSQVAVRDFASFGPQYQGIDAGYDQRSDSIILDPQVLRDHSYYAFGTALAQSMSAYQTRALQQPGFHEDANEVALWRQGIESYNALDATPEAYTANPLKLHAHAAKESFAILLKLQHTLGPEEGPEKTRIAEPQSRTATYKFVIDEPGKGSRPYLLEVPKGMSIAAAIKSHPDAISKLHHLTRWEPQQQVPTQTQAPNAPAQEQEKEKSRTR